MAIQRRPSDADDFGDVSQVHAVLPHPLCLSEFRRRHLRRPAAGATPGPGRGETDLSPLADEVSFEFREGAEDGKDQFSARGGGVDRFGQRLEADTASGEIFHRLQQMGE